MATINSVLERIRAYRRTAGWSVLRLAREAGVSESTLRHIDRDSWNPESETLRKLEAIIPPGFAAPPAGAGPEAGGARPPDPPVAPTGGSAGPETSMSTEACSIN